MVFHRKVFEGTTFRSVHTYEVSIKYMKDVCQVLKRITIQKLILNPF